MSAVSPLSPRPNSTTRLLFPFVTNQSGFDSAMVISNTGLDSTGTIGSAGSCTFHFFGPNAPSPHTVSNVAPGEQTILLVSAAAPGFQGYVEVECGFPLAHGFGFLSDLAARNLAATIPALVLPRHRTTSAAESAGQ